jgi:hypothetical protein
MENHYEIFSNFLRESNFLFLELALRKVVRVAVSTKFLEVAGNIADSQT